MSRRGRITAGGAEEEDEEPPVGVEHGLHGVLLGVVVLEGVDEGGEDEDAHGEEEGEHAQLTVTVLYWSEVGEGGSSEGEKEWWV